MALLNHMISIVLLSLVTIIYLEGFVLNPIKRDTDAQIRDRIRRVGRLNFNAPVFPEATEHRKISCLFVFDKEASADLNNNPDLANEYANQLVSLASSYTASVNTVVINGGVEIWANQDQISFFDNGFPIDMQTILQRFQDYLNRIHQTHFGTRYAVGVLLSNKTFVFGGLSQGPPCKTSGISLINYRPIPWNIGGLLGHELAHTLSVIHPSELQDLCNSNTTKLEFCQRPGGIPEECKCDSTSFPVEQCLMTNQFGGAKTNAPRYTICDIQMMNYFSSNIPCLLQ